MILAVVVMIMITRSGTSSASGTTSRGASPSATSALRTGPQQTIDI